MKKSLTLLLSLLILTLTACGGASNSPAAGLPSQTNSSSRALSGPTLLLVGTLKLDGAAQAVTSKQAADLLPLWQVYSEISASDTAAPAEKDALVKQIEETMTADQMKAIQGMNLTSQDIFATMQQMGLSMGRGQSSSSNNSNGNSSNFGGGGMPFGGGGPPPDMGGGGPGGGGFGGQNLSQEQIATAQASRAQGNGSGGFGGNFLPPALVNALIEYLQKLAGS